MAAKNQPSSLTVEEYSDIVVKKYLQHAFSHTPEENLTIASEELFSLLNRLEETTRSKQSEDTKAPLKAIRNAIASLTQQPVQASAIDADIDALIHLYRGLADACEGRLALLPLPSPSTVSAAGSIATISSVLASSAARSRVHPEAEAAANVRDLLRYRLSRLVTGDLWDATPNLKLKVLKIMFALMFQEKERLMVESAHQGPILRLRTKSAGSGGIATSLGVGSGSGSGGKGMLSRSKSTNLGQTVKTSKWQESLDEVSKMPGGKMMQLVKLLLLEQQQQHDYGYYVGGERRHVTDEETPTPTMPPPPHQQQQYTTPTPSIGLPAVETTVGGNISPSPHRIIIQQQQQQQEPSSFNNFDQDLLGLFDDDDYDGNKNKPALGSGGLSTALSRQSSSPAPSSSSHKSPAMFAANSGPPSSAASSSSMLTSQFNKLALSGGDRGGSGSESPFMGTAAQQQPEQQRHYDNMQGIPTPPTDYLYNYPCQQQQHQRQDSIQSSLSDTTTAAAAAAATPPPLAASSTFHPIRRGSSGGGPVDFLSADNNNNIGNMGGSGLLYYYPHQVDTSSPYFGVTHPCNSNANTFGDVAPPEIRPGTAGTTGTTTTGGGTHHGGAPLPTPPPMCQSHNHRHRHQ